MKHELSRPELEQLRKLASPGLLVRGSVDDEICTDLWLRGYVRQVLGGWKLTDKGLIAVTGNARNT